MGTLRAYVFGSRSHLSNFLTWAPVKSNILIDQTGRALLADFGLLTPLSADLSYSSSYMQGSTARWMSPELIDPVRFGFETSRPTKPSDCYALGMVIYETVSGDLPFLWLADVAVFVRVLRGERPPRKAGFSNSVWKMLEQCWESQPDARPSIEDVLRCLEMDPPSPGLDVEMEESGGGLDSSDDSCKVFFVPSHPQSFAVSVLMCRF